MRGLQPPLTCSQKYSLHRPASVLCAEPLRAPETCNMTKERECRDVIRAAALRECCGMSFCVFFLRFDYPPTCNHCRCTRRWQMCAACVTATRLCTLVADPWEKKETSCIVCSSVKGYFCTRQTNWSCWFAWCGVQAYISKVYLVKCNSAITSRRPQRRFLSIPAEYFVRLQRQLQVVLQKSKLGYVVAEPPHKSFITE